MGLGREGGVFLFSFLNLGVVDVVVIVLVCTDTM